MCTLSVDSIRCRPLAWFCGVFLLTSFVSAFVYSPLKWILAVILSLLLIMAIVLLLIRRKRSLLFVPVILLAVVPALLLSYFSMDYRYLPLHLSLAEEKVGECEMILTSVEKQSASGRQHEGTLTRVNGTDCNIRAILTTGERSLLNAGDRISLTATFSQVRPSMHLSDSYRYSEGFLVKLECDDMSTIKLLETDVSLLPYTISENLSHEISVRITAYSEPEAAALIRSLICADRTELFDARDRFSAIGVSHLFAVSGMHLSILATVFSMLFVLLHCGRRARVVPLILIVFLYLVICSFSPSSCRAFGMFFVAELAVLFDRRSDPITSLFLTTAVIVAIFPYRILSIGLLLSFSATFGILWIGLPLTKKIQMHTRGAVRAILTALAVTYSAKICTLPFSIWYFGSDSLVAPVATLILSPIVIVILILSPVYLLSTFIPPLAPIMGAVIGLPCKAVYLITDLFDQPYFSFNYEYRWVRGLGLAILLMTALLYLRKKRRELLPILLYSLFGILTVSVTLLPLVNRSPTLQFLSEGSNDALLFCSGNHAFLLDNSNGSASYWSSCQSSARDEFSEIDTLVLTHPSNYQRSGLEALARINRLRTVLIPNLSMSYDSEEEDPSDVYDPFFIGTELSEKYGWDVRYYESGVPFVCGEATVTVYLFDMERSAQPAVLLTVQSEEAYDLYLSAYVWECQDCIDLLEQIDIPDRIFVGSHGPRNGDEFEIPHRFDRCEFIFSEKYSEIEAPE